MTRLVIVDDQAMVREGFSALLAAQPDLDVVGAASDGLEAVHVTRTMLPDVVLMDVRMPNLNGIERPGGSWRCPATGTRGSSS